MILAGGAGVSATNPRGWFGDPLVNVTTPSGVAAFQARLLQVAEDSIPRLQEIGAQGVLTWDIEGQQFPASVYMGDPRIAETYAPELVGVIDRYFAIYRNAGFEIGNLIRPQQLENYPPVQTTVLDPVKLLKDKINYVRARWGARLFFIDSSADVSACGMAEVAAFAQDSLMMPEHSEVDAGYYVTTAPYLEVRTPQNHPAVPAQALAIHPNAFAAIFTPDGDFPTFYAQMLAGVKHGNLLIGRVFFDAGELAIIRSLYQQAAHG